MPTIRRSVDPDSNAGWLVRIVEQHLEWPDDLLGRLIGTTRSRITAARIVALQASTATAAGGRGMPEDEGAA